MKATVFPGKYFIVTGIPAIDMQLVNLIFDTHDEAKAGAVELELEAKGVPYNIEHVDVIISSPAGNIPKTVEGYFMAVDPEGRVVENSISKSVNDALVLAYIEYEKIIKKVYLPGTVAEKMAEEGYTTIPVSVNIPKK